MSENAFWEQHYENADKPIRRAEVSAPRATVERYLPANYRVVSECRASVIIEGYDNAGWTLDDYVIPRLLSGLIFAEEITESTP